MKLRNSRIILPVLAAALTAGTLVGCGSDNDSTPAAAPPSGAVVQGPVQFSFVFADSLTTGTRYVRDQNEVYTFTDAAGRFQFPTTPTYTYAVVSQNGTDSISNRAAIQLVAPSSARNVSALTTLIALTPTADQAGLKTKLETLGVKYDDDISKGVTAKALLVIKSVESTIEALTSSLNKSNNLPASVLSDIQVKAATAIAAEMAKPGVTLTTLTNPGTAATSGSLANTISTALTSAITTLTTKYENLDTTPATLSAAIADSTVTAVATAVGSTSSNTVTTEAAILTTTVTNTLSTALNNASTAGEALVTVVVDTTKPSVAVANIANNATNVILQPVITITFSEAIDAATLLAAGNVTLKAGSTTVTGTLAYTADTFTLTFTPSTALAASTAYTFTATKAIKDIAGNALALVSAPTVAADYVITFTTVAAGVTTGSGGGSTGI